MAEPQHEYLTDGVFTVSCIVSGVGGSDTDEVVVTVDDIPAPDITSLTASPSTALVYETVTFTAVNSGGSVDEWAWFFEGDNIYQLDDNIAEYEYSQPGTYDATLIATGPGGSDTAETPVTITSEGLVHLTTAHQGPADCGTTPLDTFVTSGTAVPVEMVCAPGQQNVEFLGWTIQSGTAAIGDPMSVATTITPSTDAAAVAQTDYVHVTMHVSVEGSGTTQPAGDTSVVVEQQMTVLASPNPYNKFVQWQLISGEANISDPTMSSTTVSWGYDNFEIRAVFDTVITLPTSQKMSISGELYDESGMPVGTPDPDTIDMVVRLAIDAEVGDTVYTETFLMVNDEGVEVYEGLFMVRLGDGTTGEDLVQTLGLYPSLFAEITVIDESGEETLRPRTEITAAPYSLTNSPVQQGSGIPGGSAPIGTLYVDTDTDETYIRVKTGWVVLN
jgi:PKD repeat protein